MTFLAVSSLVPARASAAEPDINSLVPCGGPRGTEVTVELRGRQLHGPRGLLFYEPGIRLAGIEPAAKNPNLVKARLAIAADCALGPHALRLQTEAGISNLVTFSVGALPEIKESEPNNDFDHAQPVNLDTTVDGVVEAEDLDYFVFAGKKGERVTAEVEGLRLGQESFDPRLTIYDANHRQLAVADDTTLVWQDAICSLVVPADGNYFVEVRESSFGGSSRSRYRLHLGRFPRPTAIFPPGGKLGQSLEITWLGDVLGPRKQVVSLPGQPVADYGLLAQDDRGTAPWPNPFRLCPWDNVLEVEPNNTPSEATPFTAPAAVNGILDRPDDVDYFKFHAAKGQTFEVRVFARSLRSPVDSVIQVQRSNGAGVAGNDDANGNPDSYLRFTAPVDDDYRLSIRDQLGRGGPDWVYRIEVAPVEPQLTLVLPERQQYVDIVAPVPAGNRTAILVAARRADYGGKVDLELKDLPPGVACQTVPIADGEGEVPVLLSAAADAQPAGALVDLIGRTKAEHLAVEGHLDQRSLLIRGRNNRDVWGRDTYRMATAVTAAAPFTIELLPPKAPVPQSGSIDLHVKAVRQAGFNGPITLNMLYHTPGTYTSAGVTIPEGKDEATIPLTAGGGAKLGTWKIAVLGRANVGDGPVVVSSQLVDLEVAEPLLAISYPPCVVDQGQQVAWTLGVEKRRDFAGAAKAELVGLPREVTSPPLDLTKDTKELKFTLSTTDKSPPGRHKSVICRVTLPINGEPVTQLLGTGDLRIRPPVAVVAPKPAKPPTK